MDAGRLLGFRIWDIDVLNLVSPAVSKPDRNIQFISAGEDYYFYIVGFSGKGRLFISTSRNICFGGSVTFYTVGFASEVVTIYLEDALPAEFASCLCVFTGDT